jgi:hypothetical protein
MGAKKFCTTCGAPAIPVRKEIDPFASTSRREHDIEETFASRSDSRSNYGPPPAPVTIEHLRAVTDPAPPPTMTAPPPSKSSISPLASSHFKYRAEDSGRDAVDPTKIVPIGHVQQAEKIPHVTVEEQEEPLPFSFPPMNLSSHEGPSVGPHGHSDQSAPMSMPAGIAAAPVHNLGPAPGSRVYVRWANGQLYPGMVQQVQAEKYLVGFADGQMHWIDLMYLSPG